MRATLCFLLTLLAVTLASAQQPSKEYIYLGNRVIAIEQSQLSSVSGLVPTSKVWPPTGGDNGTLTVFATGAWSAVASQSWITILSGATGSGNGTVYYAVSPQSGGAQDREATITVGAVAFSIKQLGSAAVAPPTSVSATPSNGQTGAVKTFVFESTSPAGGGYVDWIQGIIGQGVDGRDSCNFFYAARNGILLLNGDMNAGFTALGVLGTQTKLSNTQCEIDLAASTQRVQDNTMILSLAIRFQPVFAGTQTIHMLSADSGGSLDSAGWRNMGTWIPFPAFPPPVIGPSSPVSGTGTRKTFRYQVSSVGTAAAIRWGLVLLSTGLNGETGCYMGYYRSTRYFDLNAQSSIGFPGATGRAGDPGTIQSSRCQINLATSSMREAGDTLIIDIDVTFLSGMTGAVNNYFYAVDRGGNNSGFLEVGKWTIGTPPVGGLVSWWKGEGNTADSAGSNAGSWAGTASYELGAAGQAFKFNGVDSRVRVNSGTTMTAVRTSSAWVKFEAFTGRALPIVTVGGPSSASNWFGISTLGSQCGEYRLSFDHYGAPTICGATRLNPGVWTHVAHTYDGSTNRIYVNGVENGSGGTAPYTPSLGTMDIGGNTVTGGGEYLMAPSFKGVIDEVRYHDVALGGAEIANFYLGTPPPTTNTAISVTQTPPTGGATTFTFVFGGGTSSQGGRVLIGQNSGDGSQSCFLFLDRTGPGTIYLVNDSGSGSSSGTMGGSGVLTNSICEVNRAGASVVASGSNWVFSVPVRFQPYFRGSQKIFMASHDSVGNAAQSLTEMGTVTPFPAPANAPTVSVSPSSGAGLTQKFTYTYAVGADGRYIRSGAIIINSILVGSTGCAVAFNVLSNVFSLNTYGTNPSQGTPGANLLLSGPYCDLNLATSQMTWTQTSLTIQLDLTFKPGFVGAKQNYASFYTRASAVETWQTLGSWTPGAETLTINPAEYYNVSVGQPRAFTAACGGGTLTDLNWAIVTGQGSSVLSSGTSNPTNVTASTIPAAGVVTVQATGRCTAGSPLLTAQATMYMYYYQNPVGPFVSPSAGTGNGRQFLFQWSIQPGNGGIVDSAPVQLLFAPNLTSADNQCYLMFYQNTVSLREDTENAWVQVQPSGGYPPLPSLPNSTSNYSVENSQCRMNWTSSYTETDSINRRLNTNLLFKPAFVGAKGIFGQRSNADAGTTGGFTQIGSWVVTQ